MLVLPKFAETYVSHSDVEVELQIRGIAGVIEIFFFSRVVVVVLF